MRIYDYNKLMSEYRAKSNAEYDRAIAEKERLQAELHKQLGGKPKWKPSPESQKRSWLRGKYGITLEDYEAIKEQQGGKCAVCQRERPLVVDHDHKTGKVRGLLCGHCNTAIGMAGDDISVLRRMIGYLTH